MAKKIVTKSRPRPTTWFTLTSERGWRESTVHPFAVEASDSMHLATVILPQGVYDGQVGCRWHMSLQCGFTLP